jgi:putative FmdB family regulatory protein
MPILSYRCQECGKEFSKIFFNQEHAPRTCPVCGASDPAEVGPTFEVDEKAIARAVGTSCGDCEDESCAISGST